MPKIIDLHQVDAFTDKIFGGNPAGVVTNADGLGDGQMLAIAREMNLSETAFVLQTTSPEADLKLRYFTPTSEVKFCGHATVGALYQLAQLNMFGLGSAPRAIKVETNIGVLSMATVSGESGQTKIAFTAPEVDLQEYNLQGEEFAKKFGISPDTLVKNAKVLIDRNLNYLYIPATSLKKLGELQFNFGQIRQQFAGEGIVVFCLYTNETFGDDSHLHARGLAPLVGIDEDPFTGSMQAGLVRAAQHNSLINQQQQTITVEQGNFIGRPGFAEIKQNGGLTIIANAAHVFSTKLDIK